MADHSSEGGDALHVGASAGAASAAPEPAALPEIVPIVATLAGQSWGLLLSADLLPAALDAKGNLRARLVDALEAELQSAPGRGRWRAAIDSGDAAFGALFERGLRRVRLGSPGFHHERALAALIERLPFARQRLEGDRVAAWTEHAATWQAVEVEAAPTDIEAAIAAAGLDDLLAPGPQLATTLARIETQAGALAQTLVPALKRHRAPLLERLSQWGLGLQADHPLLRVHALRLVAALPSLDHDRSGREVDALVAEMLRRTLDDDARAREVAPAIALPAWLALALKLCRRLVALLPALLVAMATRRLIAKIAGVFIAGEDVERARLALLTLQRSGRDATLDRLGEAVVTEAEADHYRDAVLAMIDGAGALHGAARNAAGLPLAHVSIKVSALTSTYDADDLDGACARVSPRLAAILHRARGAGVFVNVDAEHETVRDLTIDVLERTLRGDPQLWTFSDVGVVVQAYLRDAPAHLDRVIALCRARGVRMPIRLVKGAYWDAETTEAEAHQERAPQWLNKAETDLCFQALTLRALRHADQLQLAIGSHNLRDHAFARAARDVLAPEAPPIEHQCLFATYSALSRAMAQAGWPVRIYVPVGSLLMGMAYLVRRVMENSSQVGVLTMARQELDLTRLLETPAAALEQARRSGPWRRPAQLRGDIDGLRFVACAPARLHRRRTVAAFDEALATVRGRVQRAEAPIAGLSLAGADAAALQSVSPEDPALVIGRVAIATVSDVDATVEAARRGQPAWRDRCVELRAVALMRAGERLRAQRLELAALVVLEAGKARREALADLDEAIDFCQFYAREALRLRADGHGASGPEPRGVVAVVAPWNFPIAIPCGMVAAALATGNAALLKSAEQTPLCAEALVQLLRAAGVPMEVVAHLPGDGPTTGAALVDHEGVDGVVFTGSAAVGCMLYARTAGRPARGGVGCRLAITEMGGKNAVYVAASADLDQAVVDCLRSAFGHAGQKCSALSRILIEEAIFERFVERFGAAARDLPIGAASAHGTVINPVISEEDAHRIRRAAAEAIAQAEASGGRVVVDGRAPIPLAVTTLVAPTVIALGAEAVQANADSWARREIFGPVVHCIAVTGLEEAQAVAAATPFALTGGVFSQREDDVERACAAPAAGNFYVNRPITGARVGVEPFGGFGLSGTGPKAGGDRYLAAFIAERDAVSSSALVPAPAAVATAVRAALDATKETLALPGQRTWNQRRPVGGTIILVPDGEPASARLRAHDSAARAGGAQDVRTLAVTEALAAIAAGIGDVVVFASHTPPAGLPQALLERGDRAALPRIVCSDLELEGIVDVHLHTTTVAVNTMRHGAPLVLDLPTPNLAPPS